MAPPIRILALCGYSQNASNFARQIRSAFLGADNKFQPAWTQLPANSQSFQVDTTGGEHQDAKVGTVSSSTTDAEFVFIDPPVILSQSMLAPVHTKELEKYVDEGPESTTPRAWWTAPDRKTYGHYDETVKYLHDYLRTNEPFDGVIGFSQGAAMAAALAALLEKPGLHPDFPSDPKLRPLKFSILVGGFKPRSETPDFSAYFPLKTPVLHVVGKSDPVVSGKASKQLQDACGDSRVEQHDGGHFTPSGANWRQFFASYINTVGRGGRQADVPSVESFGSQGARL